MANVKIKLSQNVVDQLAQLEGSTNSPEAGLPALFDTIVGTHLLLENQTSYAQSWSASGNSATFNFGGGPKLTFTGSISPSTAYSGIATATQRVLNIPSILKETMTGSMNYSYNADSYGGISYRSTGSSTINGYRLDISSASDSTYGKLSFGLDGALNYTGNSTAISGVITKMTVGASKFLKSATIEGNLNVSGTLSSNADSVNSTVTGQLSGYKEQYYDGSLVDVSASVVYDGSALDESILANAAAWAGNDTFSIDLPTNPGKTWQINTGTGSDTITAKGGGGLLHINTGGDNDRIILGDSAPIVDGGSGTDTIESIVSYALNTATNVENLVLSGKATINGTGNATANEITGNGAANIIDGGLNTDVTTGDILRGGAGNDTYLVRQATDTVIESANAGIDLVKSYISWALSDNVENLTFSGNGAVSLVGNTGTNRLIGGANNDTLDGGTGNDTLTGGGGADVFRFTNSNSTDLITDFVSGTDKLSLSKAVFKAFAKAAGLISETQLSMSGQPQDANDFLAFDGATGKLYYDADGNGAAAAVHIATLQGVSSISSSDILIG